MTFYLVAGCGASTTPAVSDDHLPRGRVRRYPSDTTDTEWQLIAPLIPAGRPGRRGGRPPAHARRDIVDAIRYLAHYGCVWRALPADFPPWKTVYDYHARWTADGTVNHLHNTLREHVRKAAGREPESPSAAIIDSQSVRAAETVGRSSRGYDAGNYLGWLVMPGRTLRSWGRCGRLGITTSFPGRSGAGRSGGSVSCSGRVV
jgi:putative transposase